MNCQASRWLAIVRLDETKTPKLAVTNTETKKRKSPLRRRSPKRNPKPSQQPQRAKQLRLRLKRPLATTSRSPPPTKRLTANDQLDAVHRKVLAGGVPADVLKALVERVVLRDKAETMMHRRWLRARTGLRIPSSTALPS